MLDVAAIFAPDGPLARALPGYEARPQQARMAAEVTAAIAQGRHLAFKFPAISRSTQTWEMRCSRHHSSNDVSIAPQIAVPLVDARPER